jgi:hypothetical protein
MARTIQFDPKAALDLIDTIHADIERLRGLLHASEDLPTFNPKDPRNKSPDGKLTPRGVEVCYRLFDKGKTRYAVKEAMGISFGAATHRLKAWTKAGGTSRKINRI